MKIVFILFSILYMLISVSCIDHRTMEFSKINDDFKYEATYSIPDWISQKPSLLSAYKKAEQVMSDPNSDQLQKSERMNALRKEVGEQVLISVIRYVPCYDTDMHKIVTCNSYIRKIDSNFNTSNSEAFINKDPISAGMKIFFDPSESNIKAITGVGLSPSETAKFSSQFEQQNMMASKVINGVFGDTGQNIINDNKKSIDYLLNQYKKIINSGK